MNAVMAGTSPAMTEAAMKKLLWRRRLPCYALISPNPGAPS